MEIKASSVYDIKSMKALVHLGIYKKKNPVLSYWIRTIIALTLISIFVIFRDFLWKCAKNLVVQGEDE